MKGTAPTSLPLSSVGSGGPSAIRGFLVQTLVALLEIVKSDPPFIEITIEPAMEHQQFDFLWKDADNSYATQVKSSKNSFGITKVRKWAEDLEAKRSNEKCCLILVGNIPASLDRINKIGVVDIKKRNLNLEALIGEAAHYITYFLEAEKQDIRNAVWRELIVHALTSQLEHFSTESRPISREAFVQLLRKWIDSVPSIQTKINLLVSRSEAEQQITERIQKGQSILSPLSQLQCRLKAWDYELSEHPEDKKQKGQLKTEYWSWTRFNDELLRRIFDADGVALEYSKSRNLEATWGILMLEIEAFERELIDDLHRLQSIKDRLVLYDEPSA